MDTQPDTRTSQETEKPLVPPLGRSRSKFQNNWFEQVIPEWESHTISLRSPSAPRPIRILELDTFEGGMEHGTAEVDALYTRFLANVRQCAHVDKLRILQTRTEDGLITLRKEGAKFDFIYIDASHVAIDVLHDAVLCWHMLELDGTLVFDDWSWKGYMEDVYNPRMAIMAFLQCAAPEVKVDETESQMWVTKVQNDTVPTKNPDPALMYWDNSVRFTVNPSNT